MSRRTSAASFARHAATSWSRRAARGKGSGVDAMFRNSFFSSLVADGLRSSYKIGVQKSEVVWGVVTSRLHFTRLHSTSLDFTRLRGGSNWKFLDKIH